MKDDPDGPRLIARERIGDTMRRLVHLGITQDADPVNRGELVTKLHSADMPPVRVVALIWDDDRNIVEVGGVTNLTGAEVDFLQTSGFTVPESFIPRAVL